MELRPSHANGDGDGEGRSRTSDFVINRDSRIPLFTTRPDKSSPPSRSPSLRSTTPRTESFKQRAAAATAIPRPSSAASVSSRSSSASLGTPGLTTRIPRPATTGPSRSPYRPPLTLIDAYRMAEEEEDKRERGSPPFGPDASPSPAPRPWLARHSTDEAKLRKLLNQDPQDMKDRETRLGDRRRSHIPVRPGSSASSTSSNDRRRSEGARAPAQVGDKASLFSKSKVGPNVAKTGAALARKASNSSLDGSFRSPNNKAGKPTTKPMDNAAWMKRFMERDDEPVDAGFSHSRSGLMDTRRGSTGPPAEPTADQEQAAGGVPSPEKSYAWQLDADFTAGDLQVSDSPRIRFDSDELGGQHQRMAQSAEVGDSPYKQKSTPSRPLNTKLDEIMEREALVEEEFPLPDHQQGQPFNTAELDEFLVVPLPETTSDRLRNTKLDEIKAREELVLSRKALASSRLDEIREKNSQYRPKPPTTFHSPKGKGHVQESTTAFFDAEPEPEPERAVEFMEGERIPNTPVTVYRSKSTQEQRRRQISPLLRPTEDTKHKRAESFAPSSDNRSTRERPGDVFRRLDPTVPRPSHPPPVEPELRVEERKERAGRPEKSTTTASTSTSTSTSTSHNQPRAPTQPKSSNLKTQPDTATSSTSRSTTSNTRNSQKARESKEPGQQKPSVGFTGVRRASSSESTQASKRSSMQSDGDPTERIEREMQLFAPADNQSEKGSIRAPSGSSADEREDDEDKIPEEATPRPKKRQNILSMPTPRVTGAYVETPATVKVESRLDNEALAPAADVVSQSDKAAGGIRQRRKDRHAEKGADKDTESEPEKPKGNARSRSRRRSKSGSKHRAPLLNSANPPTVKDDLMELQRTHDIEDSTLDEFGDLLVNAPEAEDSTLDDLFEGMTDSLMEDSAKVSEQLRQRKVKSETDLDRGIDMEAIDRMAKSLQTGLMGIRSAKKGIERLEGKVSHAEADAKKEESKKDSEPVKAETKTSKSHKDQDPAPQNITLPTSDTAPAYVLLPVPRLYRRSPFRLTTLGRILLFLVLWWAAENAMCWKYCRPEFCSGDTPCRWDPDDPPYGWVIPRKLDEWTTGGRGRVVGLRAIEEVEDLIADAWDYATDTDIRKIKQNDLDFDARRQWRRRMRKKGFRVVKPRVETPEEKARWDEWREARLAGEAYSRARARGEDVGYNPREVVEEEEHQGSERMDDDESL